MNKHIEVLKRMQQRLLMTRRHGEDEYDYIKRDKALDAAITALEQTRSPIELLEEATELIENIYERETESSKKLRDIINKDWGG